ncbi:hypothetical protein ACRAWC_22110 [Leifsonia sp. L25]|uniref:hypothetical protein n=1 Tax=Leifsonia sp. L25 TaxID=3423957 RepID=UPI003D691510
MHGAGDHGFTAALAGIAREKGVAGYVGDGTNRWPAVHRSDAATLVRLALADPQASPVVHAIAEEGIPARRIAEAIGDAVGVPVASVDPGDVDDHFGWIGRFFSADIPRLQRTHPASPRLGADRADPARGPRCGCLRRSRRRLSGE